MEKKTINPLDWDLGHVPPGMSWGGVDEAGRGAWAGPVVAACVALDRDLVDKWGHVLRGAKDSKKLTPAKREAIAAELKMVLPHWSVAEVDNLAIDRENILEATLQAMRATTATVREGAPMRILFVDGDRAPGTGLPERLLVEGDSLSCAVACASILAKTTRDEMLRKLDAVYPEYGFAAHKGYGTPKHQEALKKCGPCPAHRLSYAPVAACQRVDESAKLEVAAALSRCQDIPELQAWVEQSLRPAYPRLQLSWVEALRQEYAKMLLGFAKGQE